MARKASGQVITKKRQSGGIAYALRFRAYGTRGYVTLGTVEEGWTLQRAEVELENVLADVRRGIWRPPEPEPVVVAPREEPTFHVFASEYVEARRHELRPRSVEALEWALSNHLLVYFRDHKLSAITAEQVDLYRIGKVREREQGLVERPLSNATINKTIAVLARVLDAAVEYGWIETNPARGKRRRLRAEKPRQSWLELDEARSLLDHAREHRALLATMTLAGLRVSEACSLRWRHVDLARGLLRVSGAKTDAGVRTIDLSPDLLEELKLHKAKATSAEPDDIVFQTRAGTPRDRHNVRNRDLAGVVERANEARANVGLPPLEGVTNHSLRRAFASLLYEAGASPAYVMSQMGHASSALALEVYARKMQRSRATGARMDALIRGAEWAPMGTSGPDNDESVSQIAALVRNPAP